MTIDKLDAKILQELQLDSQRSHAEIGEIVGLSPSACHRRIREMEKVGLIDHYSAHLDHRALGLRSVVFVEITLTGQSEETFDRFEEAVATLPGLLECHLMAGNADYKLKLIAKDAEEFAYMHRHYLSRLPGVANMQSSFALKTVFRTTAMPIE